MKFICYGCDKPCILDAGDYAGLEVANLRCVVKNSGYCKWEKCNDGEVANLPKLTAEVFDRPDCPEWAKWAAVDKCRNAMWYEGEPKVVGSVFWNSQRGQIQKIPGKFDASDWQNSLIERPKNRVNWADIAEILRNSKLTFKEKKQELPDWCKVGEWVYLCNGTYSRIVSINDCHVNLANGISVGKNSIHEEMVPARLRPYNAEEMRGLVNYRQ
jgi:hypothetical protein